MSPSRPFRSAALRHAVAGVVCLAVALGVALPAHAKLKARSLYKGQQQPVGLALDSAGVVHFSWQSKDYMLHHAWVEPSGKKHDEVVDSQVDCGWWSSIAVDSANHPHIAYHAERLFDRVPMLMYAHFDGAAWQIEELGEGGYATAIAVDADDEPHIVHIGALGSLFAFEYLHRDDGVWERELGSFLSPNYSTPLSLALDSGGKAHVVYEEATTRRPMYATNAEGDWAASELSTSTGAGGSVVLDALDHLHFALPLAEAGTVVYRRFDGAQWVEDHVYEPSDVPAGTQNIPRSAALALCPGDRPQMLFVTTLVGPQGGVDVGFHAFQDGTEWRGALLKKKNVGPYLGLVCDPAGITHGVYALPARERQKAVSLRVTLHDLAGEWTSLGTTPSAGGARVTGSLRLHNEGDEKAPATRIAFYLSDDDRLDFPDQLIAYTRKVKALKVGASADVAVSFETAAALAGRHVIAVLDPLHERDEGDRSDDEIAGALPP